MDRNYYENSFTDEYTKKELEKCCYCDSNNYPLPVINGSLCSKCTNLHTLNPRMADKDRFGLYLNEEINIPDPLINNTICENEKSQFKIMHMDPDGDCLFRAICRTFNNNISIEDLRLLVAKNQTEDIFRAYKALEEQEYPFMKSIDSLAEFKAYITKSGRFHGCYDCYWGDENALLIIANNLRLSFIIFNSEGEIRQKIFPTDLGSTKYILLLYTETPKTLHYDLIVYKNNKLISEKVWSQLQNIFGL